MQLPELKFKPKAQLYSLTRRDASLGESGRFAGDELDDQVVINFPNLPEEIDIVRSSEWRVTTSPLLPDGFHIFDHVDPLELPFTFKMHAFEDYAINGPETILQIAARLQALQLPIINNSSVAGSLTRDVPPDGEQSRDESSRENTSQVDSFATSSNTLGVDYYFPPACVLNLMIGSGGLASGLGICCIGYVKSVSIKLKGPWLNSGSNSINRNLPSAADMSFTFVHAPSYTNTLDSYDDSGNLISAQVGAYRMKQSFYNTIGLPSEAGIPIRYTGLR